MAPDKKGAARLGAYIVFIDESGFMLTATVLRTWGPRGKTPKTYHWYRHDRVSVISGLSVSPRRHHIGLYWQVHRDNIRHQEVCTFLRQLMRHLPGHIIILWDNGPIHKGQAIRDFLAQHSRLHVEYFPGYAPELNPDEGVWDQTKTALANGRPRNKEELDQHVQASLEDLGHQPGSLRACIHTSDLPPFLS